MKRLSASLCLLAMVWATLLHATAWGATYYVRQDGAVTCANRANATDPASVSTSLSMAQVNACAAGIAANDLIYFSARGGDYTTALAVPKGGTDADNPVRYMGLSDGAAGAFPLITLQGTPITNSGVSYVVLQDLQANRVYSTTNDRAVNISGAASGLVFRRLTLSAAGYGIVASAALTGVTVDNISVPTAATNSVYFYGSGSSNAVIQNLNLSGTPGIHLRYFNNVTVQNNTIASAPVGDAGGLIYIQNSTGTLLIDNNTLTSSASIRGVYLQDVTMSGSILGNTVTNGSNAFDYYNVVGPITTSGNTATECAGVGVKIYGTSSDHIVTKNNIINGHNDGVATNDSAHDITISYNTITGTGNKSTTADGDGVTSHLTNYNIYVYGNLIVGSTASGIGMVGTSAGLIYNNTIINSGGNWTSEGGLDQVRGCLFFATTAVNPTTGTSWVARNNICVGSYPVEIWFENNAAALTTMDYNAYQPTDVAKFATLNGGTGFISWSTYASRETHAVENSNLGLKSSTDFRLRPSSPAKAAGTYITGFHDTYRDAAQRAWKNPPSIGAYQYQRLPQGGGLSGDLSLGLGL